MLLWYRNPSSALEQRQPEEENLQDQPPGHVPVSRPGMQRSLATQTLPQPAPLETSRISP